jgi:NAD(P)-dependent dehydrogenase (short-subunit alcohol dehydrogenase family)
VRSVLITGASTGIGRACALRLDRAGFGVFAGVRKESDGEKLKDESSERLSPVIIDVTDGTSIKDAAATIREATGGAGLAGLVNNAGITVQGALEYLPVDEVRRQFEVNVFGQLAVTQELLPEIRAGRGRIVFMSSIAGRAPSLPFLGPYAGSKWALEALAESWRIELLPWKIHVALIEPGSIDTPVWEKGDATFGGIVDSLPPEGKKRYVHTMERARKIAQQSGARGISPDEVAKRVEHALTARRPRTRYLVGVDARVRAIVENALPARLRDRTIGKVMGYGK